MKICLINNLFEPYDRGGAEKVVKFIYNDLIIRGHEVFVITTRPYLGRSAKEVPGVYYLSSTFYRIARINFLFRFFLHCWNIIDFITLIKVKRILKKEQPDLVLTHNLLGLSFLLPGLINKMGIKHIHTVHDLQLLHPSGLVYYGREGILDSLAAKVYQVICRNLFAKVDNLISPSHWLMQEYVGRGFFSQAGKFVLPNPVESFPSLPDRPKGDSDKFVFLYVGQIEEHKGVFFLAKTFINYWFSFYRELAGEQTKLKTELLIVGSGSKLGELGKIVYGDKKIQILGGKTNEEVRALMREADCLIVPSLCYENSPLVIYEATSCGLPVIASRIGGITELARQSGAILFQPGQEADLVKKIEYLVNNRELVNQAIGKESGLAQSDYVNNLLSIL